MRGEERSQTYLEARPSPTVSIWPATDIGSCLIFSPTHPWNFHFTHASKRERAPSQPVLDEMIRERQQRSSEISESGA